jgi:hypothetical protein
MKHLVTIAGLMAVVAPSGSAQAAPITISSKATYNDALTCYQHYALATEAARKLEQNPDLSADQAAGFQLQAILARKVLTSWSKQLDTLAGKRSKFEISADVRKGGEPIIADANAALAGDKAAALRATERGKTCASFETVDKQVNETVNKPAKK